MAVQPSTEQALERDKRVIMHGWGYIPINIVKAKGSLFWDSEGREYVDMLAQTAGVISLGHCHPRVVEAIKTQAEQSLHLLTSFINDARTTFAEKLAAVAPARLKNNCKIYASSGGSEANETALKAAMLITGRNEVISTYYSYHGGTLALMGLLGQSYIRKGPWPRFPGFFQIPNAYCYRCVYGKTVDTCDIECANALDTAIRYGSGGNVAAFIQEPVPGNGGHQVPPKKYFDRIQEVIRANNILYIIDEVQTGVGRSGKWWACDYFGIDPDIMTTSKAIGGGMPLAATLVRDDLVTEQLAQGQWHIFTFGGSPISCAAGAAVIDVINEEGLVENAARVGAKMEARVKDMMEVSPIIGDVRAMGIFIGVEIVRDQRTKEKWVDGALAIGGKALEKGAFFGVSNMTGFGNVIKMKPPLTITEEEAMRGLDALEAAIKEVEPTR